MGSGTGRQHGQAHQQPGAPNGHPTILWQNPPHSYLLQEAGKAWMVRDGYVCSAGPPGRGQDGSADGGWGQGTLLKEPCGRQDRGPSGRASFPLASQLPVRVLFPPPFASVGQGGAFLHQGGVRPSPPERKSVTWHRWDWLISKSRFLSILKTTSFQLKLKM